MATETPGNERRHGWYDLPSGAAILYEDGYPVRVSDGALDAEDWNEEYITTDSLLQEVQDFVGYTVYLGSWSGAAGEPDATAPVEVHVFVDSSDDPERTYAAWDELQGDVFRDLNAALEPFALDVVREDEFNEGMLYAGPAAIYDVIVAAVAGRCAVSRD